MSVGIRAEHLATGPGAQGHVRPGTDRLFDELYRAVREREVGAAWVQAAEGELAELADIRRALRVEPVGRDAVGGAAVAEDGVDVLARAVRRPVQVRVRERAGLDAEFTRVIAARIVGR